MTENMDEREIDWSETETETETETEGERDMGWGRMTENMDEREIDWSAFPVELLPSIGKSIQDRTGVVRFRSVCASLRSSIPPPCEILSPLPLPLPSTRSAGSAFVSQRAFYHFKLPDDVNPNPSTYSSKSWLVKVEELEFGRKRILNPLSNLRFGFPFPKVINSLDYQVVEVSKEYVLQYSSGMPVVGVKRLVLFPDSAWNSCVEDTVIFALLHEGKVGRVKYGDKKWTLVDDPQILHFRDYDDIIVYKGKPYVVDNCGMLSRIDSSMKLVKFASPLRTSGVQKHLVESCGELYVVDRFPSSPRPFTFCVYKLRLIWGWDEVKNLGDQVFILGKDSSFSVSAAEFSGCKGNCIYFTDEDGIGVFYLENQKTDRIVDFQDQRHLFQLPPSWLN